MPDKLMNTDGVSQLDILEFAIDLEHNAAKYYKSALKATHDEEAKKLLNDLVKEEEGHERMLTDLRDKLSEGSYTLSSRHRAALTDYGDFIKDVPLANESTVKQVIMHAMGREKSAAEVYEIFAALISGGVFRELLMDLANEERKHQAGLEHLLARHR